MTVSNGLSQIMVGLRDSFRAVLGYGFIFLWWLHFQLKLKVVPHLPISFAIVSIVEFCLLLAESFTAADPKIHRVDRGPIVTLVDAWIHQFGRGMALSPDLLLGFSILAIALAAFMVWHHHRIQQRVKQHLSLLNALRYVTNEATRLVVSADPAAAGAFIDCALRALIHSTTSSKNRFRAFRRSHKRHLEKPSRVASVLELQAGADVFKVVHQWPPNTYRVPRGIPRVSAAGKALEPDEDHKETKSIVYVPLTYFRHGVRLWVDESKTPHFRSLGFARNTFVDLGPAGRPTPKSLICTECPVEDSSGSRYVLCLDSNEWHPLQEVDFQAANAIASVIGIVFTELHRGPDRNAAVKVVLPLTMTANEKISELMPAPNPPHITAK